MIVVDLVLGPLLSTLLLWGIGKKMQYDFLFRNLLIITFCSSLGGLIPYAGAYVGALVFIILFCVLEKMPASEVLWVALIAFVIKWCVVIALMISVKSAMDHFSREDSFGNRFIAKLSSGQDEEAEMTNDEIAEVDYEPEPVETSGSGIPSEDSVEPELTPPPKWFLEEYHVSGIARSGNEERAAIVNGKILRKGDAVDKHFYISRIEDDFVELSSDDHRYRLYR